MKTSLRFFTNYLTAFIGISLVTFLFKVVITEVNNTTVALGFLLVVLLISSTASRSYAPGIFASFFGMLCFNYFFLPPQGTLTIADPQNIVALFSFLVTAIVASHLSTTARNRTADAERKREEVWKLYLLSRSVIVTPDSETASSEIARQVLEIFSLQYCAVFLPDNQAKLKQIAVATELETEVVPYQQAVLENAFSSAELISSLPKNFTQTEKIVYYAPLKIGVKVFGVITLLSSTLDYGTIEAIAGIVALAIERARFLKEVSTTEALRKSDELKAALLASISHNLRTPLTSIRAAVESLLQEDVSWNNDALKEFHLIISEETLRLTRLIENLLEMARIEAGELKISKKWASLDELLGNVVERCRHITQSHRLVIATVNELPLIKIDSRLIAEVLTNLIENAAKYSPKASEIRVDVKIVDDTVLFSVLDQGFGIEKEELVKIFDRFYRSEKASKRRNDGTGMGLAICKGIVEAHSGEISAESLPNRGSKFTFSIPTELKNLSEIVPKEGKYL